MGTPTNIMKTLKFLAVFGILFIAGNINAQTSEPTPTPPGERPILIKTTPNPGPNPYCYNPLKCERKFGKKGGICINMREASLVGIGKLIYKRKEAKGACGDTVYAKEDCCRCFKNRCTQTPACKAWNGGGICRKGVYGDPNKSKQGLCEGNCVLSAKWVTTGVT